MPSLLMVRHHGGGGGVVVGDAAAVCVVHFYEDAIADWSESVSCHGRILLLRRRRRSLFMVIMLRLLAMVLPPSPSYSDINVDSINSEIHTIPTHEEEDHLTHTLDLVLKIYATHSEPDYFTPWQRRHQTPSTLSGFLIELPGGGGITS